MTTSETTRPLRRFAMNHVVTQTFLNRRMISEDDFRTWLKDKLIVPDGYVIFGEKRVYMRKDELGFTHTEYPNTIYTVTCQAYWPQPVDPEPPGPWDNDNNLLGSES